MTYSTPGFYFCNYVWSSMRFIYVITWFLSLHVMAFLKSQLLLLFKMRSVVEPVQQDSCFDKSPNRGRMLSANECSVLLTV